MAASTWAARASPTPGDAQQFVASAGRQAVDAPGGVEQEVGEREGACAPRAGAEHQREQFVVARAPPRRAGPASPGAGPARRTLHKRASSAGSTWPRAPQDESAWRRERRVVDVDLHDHGATRRRDERKTGRRIDERRGADRRGRPRRPSRGARRGAGVARRRATRRTTRCRAAAGRRTRTPAGGPSRTGRPGAGRDRRGPRARRRIPGAARPPDVAVQFEDGRAARALVQAVDVLRDQRERRPGAPGSAPGHGAPGSAAALPMMPCRHRYHSQTRAGSRAKASGVARSVAL